MSALAAAPGVDGLVRVAANRRLIFAAACLVITVPVAVYSGARVAGGSLVAALAVAALIVPVMLWRSLRTGVVLLVVLAASVEQFRYEVAGTGLDSITDRIPIFTSLNDGFGLSGVSLSPIDVLIGAVLIGWILTSAVNGTLRLPRSALAAGLTGLAGLAVLALVIGLARGGSINVAVFELRPFLYILLLYVLTSQLLPGRHAVMPIFWAFVVATGIKAIEGVVILVQVRDVVPRPEAILGHEEAFFFGLFSSLVLALWLFDVKGKLRVTATLLLPLVLVADLGNGRRVAWLILAADVVMLLAAVWVCRPQRRRMVARIALCSVTALAVYLPLFWNNTSVLAEPARAARSIVDANARDASSGTYRVIEDANLGVNIKNATPVGAGLGTPVDYSAYAITDLSAIDSFIRYIPHNGLLWVWLRTGMAGEFALWAVAAAVMLAACRLLRSRDHLSVLVGAVGACVVVQWVIMGYSDLGFYWFRIAIAAGCVFGLVEAARRREKAIAVSEDKGRA